MPPKGYVGIEVTPRRKMLLREVMQAESFNKATEALDFAIAFAQRFVKIDADLTGDRVEDMPNVPDYINYYVGDARSLTDAGQVGGLVERAHDKGVGIVTNSDWRLDALNVLRNMESSSMTLTDAVDFALTSYLMHSRDTLSAEMMEYRDTVKAQVRVNAVAFREELTQFRKDNMEQQERDARYDGTKNVKKERNVRRAKKLSTLDDILNALGAIPHDATGACIVCVKLRNFGINADLIASMHRAGTLDSQIKRVDPQGNRVYESEIADNDEIKF